MPDLYQCRVCGRAEPTQWPVVKCEARHTWDRLVQALGRGGRDG